MNGFVKKIFCFHTDEITPVWISYGKSTDGNYYYDKKSITKVSPQIFKVWTKLKYSLVRKSQIIQEGKDNGLPMDDWEKIDYTMDLLELDFYGFMIYSKSGALRFPSPLAVRFSRIMNYTMTHLQDSFQILFG